MLTVKKLWLVKCLKSVRHELLICHMPKLYKIEVCSQNTHILYLFCAEGSFILISCCLDRSRLQYTETNQNVFSAHWLKAVRFCPLILHWSVTCFCVSLCFALTVTASMSLVLPSLTWTILTGCYQLHLLLYHNSFSLFSFVLLLLSFLSALIHFMFFTRVKIMWQAPFCACCPQESLVRQLYLIYMWNWTGAFIEWLID